MVIRLISGNPAIWEIVARGAPVHFSPSLQLSKRQAKRRCERIFYGPLRLPSDVTEVLREAPEVEIIWNMAEKGAGGPEQFTRPVLRYRDVDAVTWLVHGPIPEGRQMIAVILCSVEGFLRVHCWSAPPLARNDTETDSHWRIRSSPKRFHDGRRILARLVESYAQLRPGLLLLTQKPKVSG